MFRDDFPSPSSSDKRYAVILVGSHTKVCLLLAVEPNLIIRLLVWRIPCVYSRDGDKILEFLAFGNVKKQKQRMFFFFFVIVVSLIKTAKRRLGGGGGHKCFVILF